MTKGLLDIILAGSIVLLLIVRVWLSIHDYRAARR